MPGLLSFDYYYGLEGEQFSFFRIPKLLIQDAVFQELSDRAKILYGIMLDRMSLSRASGWLDKQGRVYIVFSVDKVAKALNCSRATAGKAMAELDTQTGIGLIERVRRGQGKPDIIYVKNFVTFVANNPEIGKVKTWVPEDLEGAPDQESELVEEEDSDVKDFDFKKSNSLTSKVLTSSFYVSGNQKTLHPEVQSFAPSYNENNHTEGIYTESEFTSGVHQQPVRSLSSSSVIHGKTRGVRKEEDANRQIENLKQIIRENIQYDLLQQYADAERRQISEEIYKLICDVVCIPRETIRINGENYPYQRVKEQFLKLTFEHVEQVIEQLEQNFSRITNVRNYMLTALYNAPDTFMLCLSQQYRSSQHAPFLNNQIATSGHGVQK